MITRRSSALALAAGLLLTGCTGVPTSSEPQTVEELNVGSQPTDQAIKPTPGADPRLIVTDFLRANAVDPGRYTSAKAFLTPAARNRWSYLRATIISDEVAGTYDQKTQTVTVFGRSFGSLDKDGIFKPSLAGTGAGGTKVQYRFKLSLVDGQYRIAGLPNPQPGLLLSDRQFALNYTQRSLYFFDAENRYLVQDPRYSDIVDRGQLSKWLLDRLAGGPREELQNAVASDTLPAQADAARISVRVGTPSRVEIPGSSQLDPGGRDRLAAQLSETLDDPLSGGEITITDGGRPISIRRVGGPVFDPSDFTESLGPPPPPTDVYYLSNGRIFTETGKPLGGVLGRGGTYFLTSAALRESDTGPLLVAGVQGTGDQAQLWVGNEQAGLKPTGVRGPLSRPAFAPARPEVWIGAGPRLLRVVVSSTGAKSRVESVAVPEAPDGAQVRAVRLSPDGVRIALVISGPGQAAGQLMIGSIVRGSGAVRVDALEAISPQQALITDVAWLTPLRLFAIGSSATTRDDLTFDAAVDGTGWKSVDVGLSSPPDHVTVAAGAAAWVSAGGFVWEQSGPGQWLSPAGGQTAGTAPIYLE